ncbi:DEAD/DEAH box helicase [Methylicorpusculum sp.]|uniref:DEAD/DEAH box helicase n=3 Tax=Methylicorpusculum sp. TaxID=2713644 RepID=UPI00271B8B44|nr:DEAD/DEAH box helicase [Methylicorpusculum sp.]MDO8842759.1 DEAD/DEAH box helicase [Methylicorpusculum sp.]MDP2178286.1 DEAD/DEAH box helicase [Methylicorpusculum sp.]MDP3531078.1 DEAD/DEAH box helicase [Methylicorpusculum sp.]
MNAESTTSFKSLGLADELVQAVTEQGYLVPTPIQFKAIPLILKGCDVMAKAQTGTGKTAAFALPMLQHLSKTAYNKPRPVRALILTPTRELAAQVHENVTSYGKHVNLFAELIYGGVSMNSQTQRLRRGCDIVVATPGRLLDHIRQGHVTFDALSILVLDEADRMLDMGFSQEINAILAMLPSDKQSLLFSATLSGDIKHLATQWLKKPVDIEIAASSVAADTVIQSLYPIKREYKRELLSYLIGHGQWRGVLVFVRTKHGADRLGLQLLKDGIKCAVLHGDKTQGARSRALDAFKLGKVQVLVATDIAARGLDIDQLPYVVNFDLPSVAEDYIHRIGRTGRAGLPGNSVSLVCPEEGMALKAIEKLLKQPIPRVLDTGYEPVNLEAKKEVKPSRPEKKPMSKPASFKKPAKLQRKPEKKRFSAGKR